MDKVELARSRLMRSPVVRAKMLWNNILVRVKLYRLCGEAMLNSHTIFALLLMIDTPVVGRRSRSFIPKTGDLRISEFFTAADLQVFTRPSSEDTTNALDLFKSLLNLELF